MSHALLAVDGVLRKLVGNAPIPEGIRLYRSLAATGHIILLSDDDVAEWLDLHGCTKHSFVYAPPPHQVSRAGQANGLRREGYAIDLVVVPDPVDAQELIGAGFNTLLFTHAQYALPSWRPDTPSGVRAWDEITHQVAAAARLKAADERLKADD